MEVPLYRIALYRRYSASNRHYRCKLTVHRWCDLDRSTSGSLESTCMKRAVEERQLHATSNSSRALKDPYPQWCVPLLETRFSFPLLLSLHPSRQCEMIYVPASRVSESTPRSERSLIQYFNCWRFLAIACAVRRVRPDAWILKPESNWLRLRQLSMILPDPPTRDEVLDSNH